MNEDFKVKALFSEIKYQNELIVFFSESQFELLVIALSFGSMAILNFTVELKLFLTPSTARSVNVPQVAMFNFPWDRYELIKSALD